MSDAEPVDERLGRDVRPEGVDRLAHGPGAVQVQQDALLDPQARRAPGVLDGVDDLARKALAAADPG